MGAEQCKLCHRAVYESWLRTPHARTGTVDIDGAERCNACHTTDVRSERRGIQCEACHGAGSDYWPAEVMIDPGKAAMAGLVQPTAATCRRCHEPDDVEPNHRRDFVMPPDTELETSVHVRGAR